MSIVGYQASHEQFAPSELVRLAVMAEKAGFQAINSSDHFHPWSERQGQSGYSFAWLGAAMQATSLPFGVVCSPGQRNHPAIVAQASATLAEMFPGRFHISLGSGEALNERITGEIWPIKSERNARLREAVDVIRDLFTGKEVTRHGRVTVECAKLYTLPSPLPLLYGAAVTEETAEWVGSWADGLTTIHKPLDELEQTVKAFRKGGGEGKPMIVKVQLSYARDEQAAIDGAYDQWRTNIFQGTVLGDLHKVEQFDALGEFVTIDKLKEMVNISSDLQVHADLIASYIDLGFDTVILHNVNRDQETFIQDFGEKVLPKLAASASK
ncbi:TIGR03885 family FMN-dependent LLM class oxidoreductase [Segetibacter aerophilus]|uniref:LLM class F420-dependent oxidoreductase n=1 Tax=Segetibacter aerophilus TaxID=670293 RepID=A0A512BHX2_9BACT|nr:TIGR03885 family FMN-dependent LLM class oxidoreductase [Segetibacter aerophilus]GEO11589.1 LLM class F420-dependent oxidoreductase [Segetibacter aerophilus]